MISFLGLYQLGVQFFLFGCNFSFCGFISSLCVLLSRPGYHSVLLIFRFFRNIGWVGVLRWFMQRYSFSGNWFRYLVPLVYGDTQWTLFPVQFWVCRRVRDDCGSRFQPKWTEVLHSKLKMEFVLTLILDSTCLSRWSDILFEPNERVENRWRANPYNHMILHVIASRIACPLTICSVSRWYRDPVNSNQFTCTVYKLDNLYLATNDSSRTGSDLSHKSADFLHVRLDKVITCAVQRGWQSWTIILGLITLPKWALSQP